MAKKQDILLNEDYTFKVINGDFAVGDSDQQNVDLLLQLDKGQIRELPLNGIGIQKYINTTANFPNLKNKIQKELQSDGYSLNLFYYDRDNDETIIDFT